MEENNMMNLDLNITEDERSTEVEATFDIIDMSEIDINIVESQNAFPPIGEPNENLRHSLLNGRDVDDQHPISAITGLKNELDKINALKTVYSDKMNVANYYQWADDVARDEAGYFVSFMPGTSMIKICEGADVGGVTVDAAAFVGGQDDDKRNNQYALVVVSGPVDVRCESDVESGDYVIPNAYGIAQKTTTKFGYMVIAINDQHGTRYATISLGVQSDKIDLIGKDVQHLDLRMGNAEKNITSSMQVAQNAYNKAAKVESENQTMSDKVDGALGVVGGVASDMKDLTDQVVQTDIIAAQAKSIAETAVTYAESLKKEAVDVANKAMADNSTIRDELSAQIGKVDEDLNNTAQEMQATAERLQGNIDDTIDGLNSIAKDLEPLSIWHDDQGNSGVAGFVARADEDSAKIVTMVKWQGETDESIAAFKQEVKDGYATQEMVSNVDDALTSYKQEVEKNYATQQMLSAVEYNLTSFKQEVKDDYATQHMVTTVGENLASYKQEVETTYATQEMFTVLETDTSKALIDYKQEVKDEYATQNMVIKLEEDASKALADYKQEVGATYATQQSLANLKTETTNAIVASEEKATATFASQSDLTSFEGELSDSIARVEQKSDGHGASINSIVSSIDKYSVGEYSQSYGLTRDQAKSILRVGMIYIPTAHADSDSHSEFFVGEDEPQEFTPGAYYEWDGEDWIEHGSSVWLSGVAPVGPALQYWYTDSEEVDDGYEPYTLYTLLNEKCTKVNIYYNNPSNRKTSAISQDVDNISLEITNARGSYSGLDARLTNVDSQLQLATFWNNPETEKGNLATVKLNSDDEGSSLALVVMSGDGETQLEGASIVLGQDGQKSFIKIDSDSVLFTSEDFQVIADKVHFDAEELEIIADNVSLTSEELEVVASNVSLTTEELKVVADNISLTADELEIVTSKISFTKEELEIIAHNVSLTTDELEIVSQKIDLDGYVTITSLEDEDSTTTINGALIQSGIVESRHYEENGDGMRLNLDDGTLDSQNFKILSNGTVETMGKITATHLTLVEDCRIAGAITFEKSETGDVGDIEATSVSSDNVITKSVYCAQFESVYGITVGGDITISGHSLQSQLSDIESRLAKLEANGQWNCDTMGHRFPTGVDPSSMSCTDGASCTICNEFVYGEHGDLESVDGKCCGNCTSTSISFCNECKDYVCDICGSTDIGDDNQGDSGDEGEHVHSYSSTTGRCACGAYCSHVWKESWSQNTSSNTHRYIKECSICGYVDTDEDVVHTYSTEDGYCACGAQDPDW